MSNPSGQIQIPNTQVAGKILSSVGDGQSSAVWSGLGMRMSASYVMTGVIAVASGAAAYIPPFFVPVLAGSTCTFVGVNTLMRGGSATLNINQNGVAVPGLGGIVVSTTATLYKATGTVPVADGDQFAPVVMSVSGADGMTVSFYFQISPAAT